MNYYEHHLRDYEADTSHLTWDQDMAYTRLIRWYYRKERPIPSDIKEACRLMRATSKAQRDAVAHVLEEFFEQREDGWHNDTCDAVISAYLAGEPEREAKKKNEETRLARHRKERSDLFAVINEAGCHLPWNAPIKDVRELAERISKTKKNEPETPPATAHATPATATQTPIPNTQYPVEGIQPPLCTQPESRETGTESAAIPDPPTTEGHWLTWFNREASTNLDPSSRFDREGLWPTFRRWCDAGITQQQMRDAVQRAFETATEPIANLPKYVDRVLANSQRPEAKPSPGQKTAAAAARWLASQGVEP